MSQQAFIVTYDVHDPKRLRKVYKLMRGFGRHIQLSVFYCQLDGMRKVELRSRLGAIVKHDEDQVLFVDIGPADGRALESIESVGRAYVPHVRKAIVA